MRSRLPHSSSGLGSQVRAWGWRLVWLGAGLFGILLWGGGFGLGHAQGSEPWTPAVQMSDALVDEAGMPLKSAFPVFVSDPWGGVHALWTVLQSEQGEVMDGMVFYSYWDGAEWSAPVDILYAPQRPMWLPQAAIGPDGRLHLVWMYGAQGPVWYSSALATEAGSALSWSEPLQLTDAVATGAAIAVDAQGRVHVAYATGLEDDRVYILTLEPGSRWSDPLEIAHPCDDCIVRLAVDGGRRLHAVFGSQGVDGQAVYYARRDRGGDAWEPPVELDHVDARYAENYGPAHANVIASGVDQVHVVWDGAPAGQRWHQFSSDGGLTWTYPQQVSPDHRGLTLPVAMGVDSAGTLHLISMGWREIPGKPSGPFHLYWEGGQWSQPELIGSRSDWDAEYPALAIAAGNMLHAAWTEKLSGTAGLQVWTSSLTTKAPARPPQASPTSPNPAATASPTSEVRVEGTPIQAASTAEGNVQGASASQANGPDTEAPSAQPSGIGSVQPTWWPVLAGVLPVSLVLVLILIVRMSREGHR
jgi:hypothetical protein